MKAKNISRFTYQKTAFQGWRLALRRKGNQFVRYFSDKQYRGSKNALHAAMDLRNSMLAELKKPDADPQVIFQAAHELIRRQGKS